MSGLSVKDGKSFSGHHRVTAAIEAGLETVPAWVRDFDDEEAMMQLVLANSQGELHPLERGLHALRATEGGMTLRSYATRIPNVDEKTVHGWKYAAEVAVLVNQNFPDLLPYMTHLSYIHAAPEGRGRNGTRTI